MDDKPKTWHDNEGEIDAIQMRGPKVEEENNFTEKEQYRRIGNKVEIIREMFEKAKEVIKPVLKPLLVGVTTAAVGVGALAIAHNIPHQEPQQIEENITQKYIVFSL